MAHMDLAAKCQVLKLSARCVNDPGTVAGGRWSASSTVLLQMAVSVMPVSDLVNFFLAVAVSGLLEKLGFCRSFRKCPPLWPKPCHPICVNARNSLVQRNAHWMWTDLGLSWLFMEALRSKATTPPQKHYRKNTKYWVLLWLSPGNVWQHATVWLNPLEYVLCELFANHVGAAVPAECRRLAQLWKAHFVRHVWSRQVAALIFHTGKLDTWSRSMHSTGLISNPV